MEPLTSANRITYLYFCTLGGLSHPRTAKLEHVDGRGQHLHYTYHLRRF